ncbi:Arsenical pump membrane protein, ArsB [Acididesulfobacillus acetoxydans]|uniref:Arsenical pump membrane protein n=1 Tax=Acididesulfobacillus acetoxydans TaxID=1561005 RepID=A0A8S0Y2X4_9FIRM|nr:SLC13 family permease [Acididesulfobacillus acetoxydans]CAA7601335.1 Arsenical pump membrane protein, ArsB [Acididesulfobacillus acetoxydans]CEJ09367.1 Arsenical pump membrane protein [Acididesulfobacillus acetoxydans]
MVISATIISGLILTAVLIIFTLGKSPVFRVDRAGAAIIGATMTVATGVLTFAQATRAVDYRTIILLFAMMLITSYMNIIGLFEHLSNCAMHRLKTPRGLLGVVIVLSGLLSAVLVNDIVCLLITPIIISVCRRARINPVPYLLAAAMASNIGSAATLIGNPQNILIGSLSHLAFAWYSLIALPLSLMGLLLTYVILERVYAQELRGSLVFAPDQAGQADQAGVKPLHRFLLFKGVVVLLGVLTGFLLGIDPAIVASLGATVLLITRRLKPNTIYEGIDFNLLVIFVGLFVIVGGVEHSGLLKRFLGEIGQGAHLPVFMLLTLVLSNIVSNVPAVMLIKFVIPAAHNSVWWANLALFSTFAGNLTITGSIANLIVVEIAKKNGITIRFFDHLRIGFPVTLVLVLVGMGYFKVLFGV